MAVARHAGANDGAVNRVQCGEQGGGAVTLVVMGHGPAAPFLDGQTRLSAIQGLNLALLID